MTEQQLRTIRKLIPRATPGPFHTEICRMEKLVPGDIFRFIDDITCEGWWEAKGEPYLNENSVWTIVVDPAPEKNYEIYC